MFGIFGRSHELKRLDRAVRAVGLHPILVPEAVKLTTVRFLKDDAYDAAAEMLAYCMLGSRGQRPMPD